METECGADHPKGRDRHAQLCRRADALRPDVPGRRLGAHRAADRSKRSQSRDRRRLAFVARAFGILSLRAARSVELLFGELSTACLAGPAVLMVDDVHAAQIQYAKFIR